MLRRSLRESGGDSLGRRERRAIPRSTRGPPGSVRRGAESSPDRARATYEEFVCRSSGRLPPSSPTATSRSFAGDYDAAERSFARAGSPSRRSGARVLVEHRRISRTSAYGQGDRRGRGDRADSTEAGGGGRCLVPGAGARNAAKVALARKGSVRRRGSCSRATRLRGSSHRTRPISTERRSSIAQRCSCWQHLDQEAASCAAAVAGTTHSLSGFMLAHGVLIGVLGSAAMFAPLIADTSLWWVRRRGIAVAICASGNYLGGTLWPPVIQHYLAQVGWRQTYFGLGLFCFVVVTALALFMRRRPPITLPAARGPAKARPAASPFGLTSLQAQTLLCIAGVACCVAMSMPQVHIVAYCADLGYGAARGAQMLSVMFAFGIASRLISGAICDRIGGLRTLLLGSVLQGVALLLFLPFDSLVSLFVIAALFGLFQGGIVPAYAIIIREHFPASEAGARVGLVIMCSLFGMALGGWMSGKVFDVTGSYGAAFLNGIAWNALNLTIAFFLLYRARMLTRRTVRAAAA